MSETERHSTGTLQLAAALAAVFLLMPTLGSAQSPATSFSGLSMILRTGQQVVVTSSDGRRLRGRSVSITGSTLVVAPNRRFFRQPPSRDITESSVTTVARMDSPWEGMTGGFLAGFLPTALAMCAAEDGDGQCTVGVYYSAPLMGFVGMAIGGWLDFRRNDVVYRAATPIPGRTTAALAPILTKHAKGVVLTLSF
jgi:hypothetical protein